MPKNTENRKDWIIKCYVPTHSLINYIFLADCKSGSSLASLDCVDGYIAQVWTGTAREPNFYNGVQKERVFENCVSGIRVV